MNEYKIQEKKFKMSVEITIIQPSEYLIIIFKNKKIQINFNGWDMKCIVETRWSVFEQVNDIVGC